MTSKESRPKQATELRRQAEEIAWGKTSKIPEDRKGLSPDETRQTVHELQVHQIELEMQNEELRRAQAELDASRARYFDLYDLAPVGYCTISEKGMILETNLTAATLLDVTRGALVTQSITRFILKDDQDIYYRHRKLLFDTGEPQSCELRMLKKGETVFWGHLAATAAQDADGTPICRVVMSDITERKQAEETLKKSQSLLAETERVGKVGGWEFNIDTGKQTWTEEVYRIHEVDITFDPTVGKGVSFYSPASRPIIEKAVQQTLEHGEPFDVELEIVTAKGNLRSVHAIGKADPEHRRVYGFFQDISARKRIENDLKEAWNKLRSLSSYVDSMYLVDCDGTYLFMNERQLKRFGLALENVVGKKYNEFHSEADSKEFAECVGEVCGNCKETTKEHRSERDKRYFLRTFTPIIGQSRDGKISQVAVISKDITNIKQAEAEVRLNEARLTSLLNISQHKAETIQELLDFALDEAIKLTESMIGYIYYYNDQKEEFTLNTWSKKVMAECSIAEPQAIYHLQKTGIWGEVVRQAQPIMLNDYQAPHPLKKGYPESHAPLYKFLTIPIFSADRIVAVVAVANKQTDYDESDIRQLTLMMDSVWRIADRKRAELDLIASEQSLRKAVRTTIQIMVSTVEARDPYTSGHQVRTADLSRAIATEMGLPQERIEGLRMAASIHDLGKISIPTEILSKPTKLSDIELSLIKEHSHRGFELLKNIESSWPLAEIVYQHHERMDGSGYPRSLKGEEICIEARILTVADVVEAMASHRPYRAGLGIDIALNEIEKNRGIFYDNAVADACLRLFREQGFKLEGT
jgi:PAS domain S-box-containing protein